MRVRIEVTKRDIKRGKPRSVACCPIALAAKRRGLLRPLVTSVRLEAGRKRWRRRIALPLAAVDFIHAFDDERGPTPIAFTVDVPVVMLRRKRRRKAA